MPFVKIDLFEGRSEEQKIELAREVTEVVSRVAKAPKEAIHVFINDMPEGTYYPHGEMKKKGSIISVVGKTTVEIMELFECTQKVP